MTQIAIVSPGDRTDKITTALDTTVLDYTVNPDSFDNFPVIICDSPDRDMFKTVIRNRFSDKSVIFRMRGDPYHGINEWIDSRIKRYAALKMLDYVDGCIAIAPHQAIKYERKTGIRPDIIGLPIDVTDWPNSQHFNESLRIVTLTNTVYIDKIRPLIEIAPVVNEVLEFCGGYWEIGSWSDGYDRYLNDSLRKYSRIEFSGELDAKRALDNANCMLHYSEFDVLPNAVLEAMASKLPVLTNDYVAFTQTNAPVIVNRTESSLYRNLIDLQNHKNRRDIGAEGYDYVKKYHSPEYIGDKFVDSIGYYLYKHQMKSCLGIK